MKAIEFDQKIWEEAARQFELDIQFNFTLSDGKHTETYELLLKGYGAPNGMIIDQNFNKVQKLEKYILENGFGFSCLALDSLEAFEEVLMDWGRSKKA